MSLLMDALRRAEAEKKAAAESKSAEEKLERKESHQENSNEEKSAGKLNVRDDGDSQSSVSDELSEDDEDLGATVKLDRLPLSMTTKPEAADKPAVEDITSSIEESLNDLSIDFESTSPRMRSDEILSADRSRENRGNSTDASGNKADSDHEEAFDFSIHAEPHLDKDGKPLELEPIHDAEITSAEPVPEPITGKTQTLPSAKKIGDETSAQQNLHQENPQDSEPTLAASDIDPLLIALPGESTLETSSGQTAVSANTVFEAGSPGISRRIILWTLSLGVALFALLAVTGLYYFQQAPTARQLPSPIASVELEKARLLESQSSEQNILSNATPAAATELSMAAVQENSLDSRLAIQDEITTNSEAKQLEENIDEQVQPSGPGSKAETESAQNVTESSQKFNSEQQDTRESFNTETTKNIQSNPTFRSTPTIDTKRLSIARSLRSIHSNEQVLAAYSAYQAGDLDGAKVLYEKALAIRPEDINALNGLAALALGESNKELAHQLYSRVLKLEPNNPTATTALFQIEGGVGNRVTESQLKMMLDNDGDPGLINFALGNLYSRHQRWNDAQLAFFEAVRHRPENPDYLFNLAVSLDQIGQRTAALDYYQKAVTAADDVNAGFNASDAIARIQAITQSASASAP